MEWYYAKDRKQMGPIQEHELQALHVAGQINGQTLIWKAGMAAWEPYDKIFSESSPVGQMNTSCSRCGRSYSEQDLIKFEGLLICAQCKPVVFQQLKETGSLFFGKLWRSGNVMVMCPETELPNRCVKCNAPAQGDKLKRKLFWHNPLIYFCLLLNILVYAIVASLAGKRATIHIGLCEQHKKKRWMAIGGGWGSALLGFLLIVIGASATPTMIWLVVLGVVLILLGLVIGALFAAQVRPKKITPEHLFIKGVCREYLDTLPEWTGNE